MFFESTYRIIKTIEAIVEMAPNSQLFVAKEMTKMFENYFVGKPAEVLEKMKSDSKNSKGEFVMVLDFSKDQRSGF